MWIRTIAVALATIVIFNNNALSQQQDGNNGAAARLAQVPIPMLLMPSLPPPALYGSSTVEMIGTYRDPDWWNGPTLTISGVDANGVVSGGLSGWVITGQDGMRTHKPFVAVFNQRSKSRAVLRGTTLEIVLSSGTVYTLAYSNGTFSGRHINAKKPDVMPHVTFRRDG